MRRTFYPVLLIPLLIVAVYGASTFIVSVIPSVPVNNNQNVIPLCNPLITSPAYISPGTNGTVIVTCPAGPALQFKPYTGTPSINPSLTGAGYNAIWVIYNGYTCNLPFQMIPSTPPVPSGAFLNHTITFSASPTGSQLLSGTYNYCLSYTNAPVSGLGTVSVTWP